MPVACPVTLDQAALKEEVRRTYSQVAADPSGDYHFRCGPQYASERLGYDAEELALLPALATAPFAGVANPHLIAPLREGETVLDIGCGAGMDLLLAARHVGPSGRAIGVDLTAEMRERARAAAREAGFANVEVRAGDAESLPVESGSADAVISNGVLNLVPNKQRAFAEIVRVLKPGGRLQLGDIVVQEELDEETRSDIELWTG